MSSRFLNIRPMRAEDYPRVAALWEACEFVLRTPADTFAGVTSFLNRSPGLSVVAERGEKIVGATLCGEDGRAGFIHSIAVAPDQSRHSTERQMIRRCLLYLRALGLTECYFLSVSDVRVVQLGHAAPTGLHESMETLAS